MLTERRQIPLGDGHSVSAAVAYPTEPVAHPGTVVILAHGAGNDMNSPFLSAVHEGLAGCGYVTVKFNFLYKEMRRGAPDRPPVLEATYARVLDAVCADARITAKRVIIGGKSLGGRIATHIAAHGAAVSGLILLGYPLHPPRRQDQPRVAHLSKIGAPMLFFCGTRDALCDLELLRRTLKSLRASITLHVIQGADHSFNLPKKLGREADSVWGEIIGTSAEWLGKI
jgi:predicted alpha/beta-hydrolase family hydrolase